MAQPPLMRTPPPGETLGLGRKESIYDTEGQGTAGALAQTITTFENFKSFVTTGLTQTKKFGRDTNLRGGASFLPTGYKFGAYRWRVRPHSLDPTVNSFANSVHFDELRRYRQLSFCSLFQDQSSYITASLWDLASWADNERIVAVATTQTAAGPAVMTIIPTIGHQHEGRALDVNGQPFVLNALENWRCEINTPQGTAAALFTPTLEIYVTPALDGVLVRPTN